MCKYACDPNRTSIISWPHMTEPLQSHTHTFNQTESTSTYRAGSLDSSLLTNVLMRPISSHHLLAPPPPWLCLHKKCRSVPVQNSPLWSDYPPPSIYKLVFFTTGFDIVCYPENHLKGSRGCRSNVSLKWIYQHKNKRQKKREQKGSFLLWT